jgi:hypothetical protein
MSYRDPLAEREHALEDAFFRREEARLRQAQREEASRAERFEQLSAVLGPRDPGLIDPLLDVGLRAENATALMMAPLVAVAWADHQLDATERRRILQAELELGIEPDSEPGRLVLHWLDHRPSDQLLDAWAGYVSALCKVLEPADRHRLRDEILGRCRGIAGAIFKSILRGSGPVPAEREALAQILAAFHVEGEDEDTHHGRLDEFLQSIS